MLQITLFSHKALKMLKNSNFDFLHTSILHRQQQTIGTVQTTHKPASTLDEPSVCKWSITQLTQEAVWMPTTVHCLDDTANYELL